MTVYSVGFFCFGLTVSSTTSTVPGNVPVGSRTHEFQIFMQYYYNLLQRYGTGTGTVPYNISQT